MPIMTVTGPVQPEALGIVLMHEHVFVEYGGPSAEYCTPGGSFDTILSRCCAMAERIKRHGVKTVVDPTTADLGRNVPLLTALAHATGIQYICATGIYSAAVYRQLRARLGGQAAVADLFVRELTDGIDRTEVRAGIIKIATGARAFSRDERELLEAAAHASCATGAPIMTHTDGVLGDEQQRLLISCGVPAERIVIGHSCLSRHVDYHRRILEGGSYLGFDRFGMPGMDDEQRAASLHHLIAAGYGSQLVVAHDSVWWWIDGPDRSAASCRHWTPTNFFERVIPMLRYAGVRDEQIQELLVENPCRLFSTGATA